ncbi:hypothetical protein ETW23_00385 [Leisingera sp. NJS201]|uniref:hypothetical protein n=1 Tax=Leisingera sp. NJS201 TaxID=2508306 RepID=UPI001070D96D|nr:hypothetical protein [Leisingera sp. NJS201]QBR34854.1 hypothetical protein ETW23_00385 [Leisingera sp. NJS201]
MTIHTPCLNHLTAAMNVASDAVELEGLAQAMRIVVAAFASDPDLDASNALDALAVALHGKAVAHRLMAEQAGAFFPADLNT